jgi:hypothetical protein
MRYDERLERQKRSRSDSSHNNLAGKCTPRFGGKKSAIESALLDLAGRNRQECWDRQTCHPYPLPLLTKPLLRAPT